MKIFKIKLATLKNKENIFNSLFEYNIGIEREAIRSSLSGLISKKNHPKKLGKPLTHPSITTDFAESQIEIKTEVFNNIDELYQELSDIHSYISKNMDNDEILWNYSMPPQIDEENDIIIAEYGDSAEGLFKRIYREGLKNRYGAFMQTISGIHFNFSFSENLIDTLFSISEKKSDKTKFKSELYLHVSRNILRLSPFLTYFFGISPTAEKNFFKTSPNLANTLSIRMSDLGYINPKRCKYNLSFSDIKEYIKTLEKALNKSCPIFELIGIKENEKYKQLNTNILQIEAEYYNLVRPKPCYKKDLRPIESLKENGISYIEFRGIDINPFNIIGIEKDDLYFLHLIFLFAIFDKNKNIDDIELEEIRLNQLKIAKNGLNKELLISSKNKSISFEKYALDVIKKIKRMLSILKTNNSNSLIDKYLDIIDDKREIVLNKKNNARKLLEYIKSSNTKNPIYHLSEENHKNLKKLKTSKAKIKKLDKESLCSIKEQAIIEKNSISIDEYILERR